MCPEIVLSEIKSTGKLTQLIWYLPRTRCSITGLSQLVGGLLCSYDVDDWLTEGVWPDRQHRSSMYFMKIKNLSEESAYFSHYRCEVQSVSHLDVNGQTSRFHAQWAVMGQCLASTGVISFKVLIIYFWWWPQCKVENRILNRFWTLTKISTCNPPVIKSIALYEKQKYI